MHTCPRCGEACDCWIGKRCGAGGSFDVKPSQWEYMAPGRYTFWDCRHDCDFHTSDLPEVGYGQDDLLDQLRYMADHEGME